MALKEYRPTSPAHRHMTVSDFADVTKATPEKKLTRPMKKSGGRNHHGHITTRHVGGGHKRRFRVIDWRREKDAVRTGFDSRPSRLPVDWRPGSTGRKRRSIPRRATIVLVPTLCATYTTTDPWMLTGVIRKSSNVGSSKIAMSLDKQTFWSLLSKLGFRAVTASGFPGEASGLLVSYRRWRPIKQATLSFGYGLSVTPLQLAQAYAVLAADGELWPTTFLKQTQLPRAERVLSAQAAT